MGPTRRWAQSTWGARSRYPFGVDRLSLDLAPFACAAVGTALPRAHPPAAALGAAGALALAGVAWVLSIPPSPRRGRT